MKVMKILGVLVATVGAVNVLASSASAVMVLPNFSVQTGGTFTGGSGVVFGAAETKCTDFSGAFTMNADKKSGTFDIDCLGNKAFGAECHTEGDAKEIELWKGNWQAVLGTVAGVDKHFMLLEFVEIKVNCAFLSTKIVMKGTVLGELTQTGANTFNLKIAATSKTGQEFKEYENDEGAIVKTQMLSNTNGGAFSETGLNLGTFFLMTDLATSLEN